MLKFEIRRIFGFTTKSDISFTETIFLGGADIEQKLCNKFSLFSNNGVQSLNCKETISSLDVRVSLTLMDLNIKFHIYVIFSEIPSEIWVFLHHNNNRDTYSEWGDRAPNHVHCVKNVRILESQLYVVVGVGEERGPVCVQGIEGPFLLQESSVNLASSSSSSSSFPNHHHNQLYMRISIASNIL